MEPTSSISKMFDIIRAEYIVSSYNTEELKEVLDVLQNEKLLLCFALSPVASQIDMEKIIRLEKTLIRELRERGESPPAMKFSRNHKENNTGNTTN